MIEKEKIMIILPPKHTDSKAVDDYFNRLRLYSDKSKTDYDLMLQDKKASTSYLFFFIFPLFLFNSEKFISLSLCLAILCWICGIFLWIYSKRINRIYDCFTSNHHKQWKDANHNKSIEEDI